VRCEVENYPEILRAIKAKNVDVVLLNKQRLDLVRLLMESGIAESTNGDLWGLVYLLDYICDQYVPEKIMNEMAIAYGSEEVKGE